MNTVPVHLASVVSSAIGVCSIDGSTSMAMMSFLILACFFSIAGYAKAQCTEYIRQMKAEGDRNWDRAVMLYERHQYRDTTIATCHSQASYRFC